MHKDATMQQVIFINIKYKRKESREQKQVLFFVLFYFVRYGKNVIAVIAISHKYCKGVINSNIELVMVK